MFQPQEFVFQTQEFSLWNMAFHAKLGEIKKQERERGRLRILKIKKSSYSSKKKSLPCRRQDQGGQMIPFKNKYRS